MGNVFREVTRSSEKQRELEKFNLGHADIKNMRLTRLRKAVAILFVFGFFFGGISQAKEAVGPESHIGNNNNNQTASEPKAGPVCSEDSRSKKGESASLQDQKSLLALIRDNAVDKVPTLSEPPKHSEMERLKSNYTQMRLLMALRSANLNLSGDVKKFAQGKENPEIIFDGNISQPPGFARQMAPLSAAEILRAKAAIQTKIDALTNTMRTEANAQITFLEDQGINAEVPAAEKIGSLKDREIASIRKNANVGYQEIISANPFFLFLENAQPTESDFLKANDRYTEALKKEGERIKGLRLVPPEDAAFSLLFYTPIVNSVLNQHRELCPAFEALKQRLKSNEKYRQSLTMGVGLAAAGTCTAAAYLSAGILGAGCFSLSVEELALNANQANIAEKMARVAYGGVLEGADYGEFAKRSAEAKGYMLAAGVSLAGTAAATFPLMGRASNLAKAEMQGSHAPAGGARAPATDAAGAPSSAPLATGSAKVSPVVRPSKTKFGAAREAAYQTLYGTAPAEYRVPLMMVRKRLGDMAAWRDYFTQLMRDAGLEMKLTANQGAGKSGYNKIDRIAMLKVLVKRAKARGETFSSVQSNELDDFMKSVGNGPFFDKAFVGSNLHGVDTHLLQRDFIAPIVNQATNGRSAEFYRFLGSPQGIQYWDETFDVRYAPDITSPATITPILQKLGLAE